MGKDDNDDVVDGDLIVMMMVLMVMILLMLWWWWWWCGWCGWWWFNGDDIVDIDDDVDEWKFGMSSDQLVNANGCALCSVSCISKSPHESLKNGWSIFSSNKNLYKKNLF